MKILCFGELLARLSPPDYGRLEDARSLELGYAGAEAVAAISLANQGEEVSFSTKVSTNRLGTNALLSLQRFGVETSRCTRSPGRMGLYFSERGRSIRPSLVTYDRQDTAMALASHEDFDWDSLLNGVDTFYFSGVVPAISDEAAIACGEALRACKGRGIHTTCDLNYRRGMWPRRKALDTWAGLLSYTDVLTATEDDLLGVYENDDLQQGSPEFYAAAARFFVDEMGCREMAYLVRDIDPAGLALFRGHMVSGGEAFESDEFRVVVEDLSGCGSEFCASTVHGLHRGWDASHVLNYSTIASAYKATMVGDFSYATEMGIERLLNAHDPAIIQ